MLDVVGQASSLPSFAVVDGRKFFSWLLPSQAGWKLAPLSKAVSTSEFGFNPDTEACFTGGNGGNREGAAGGLHPADGKSPGVQPVSAQILFPLFSPVLLVRNLS
jgi:hypothetical protein